ncbi:ROK family transcriptional regulator [Mycetocola miduiensis]|uniref:Sugar kinase of the NBD/HSP70 family, may contain an N-terminal HTH domain n=1 Tax=Mycetocola miduiensis TaxID=995034 RepID=A0A1I4YPJ3_9MICO|nr:ROK family transcriptional regulator [Mycetocola miduiensis]SFN39936.1 Sugar kinase of the NBD/HSP70 family, may contain an N-terminal HTH domain [Mycetocola miduiensis]
MDAPPSSADIRHANALTCIHVFRASEEPLTISDLVQRTGLSRPTIDAVINELEEGGTLTEVPAGSSRANGGRPARRFQFQSLNALVAGIDSGPSNVTVMLADLRGRVVGRASREISGSPTASQRVDTVVSTVRDALADAGTPASKLRAACVAVSGTIGLDGKVAQSYFVPEWNNTDLARHLGNELGCHVFLENDTKLAAYAEHHFGSAQLAGNILYFHIGTRIAFALTIDGKIHQGAHRSAGELASLRGFRWTTNSVKGNLTWTGAESTAAILSMVKRGDSDAHAEWARFVTEIATRIATVSLVFDPDVIVIGGELPASDLSGEFITAVRTEVRRLILLDLKPDVLASTVGAESILRGALALGFHESSRQLFGIEGVPVPDISEVRADNSPTIRQTPAAQTTPLTGRTQKVPSHE